MILSNVDILKAIEQKDIVIHPPDKSNIRAASVELKLGDCIRVYDSTLEMLDSKLGHSDDQMKTIKLEPKQLFILHPERFAIGITEEWIQISNNLVGRVEGIDMLGMMGIGIHINGGYIAPGFCGKVIFYIKNLNNLPVKIYSGMNVCQILFTKLSSTSLTPCFDE